MKGADGVNWVGMKRRKPSNAWLTANDASPESQSDKVELEGVSKGCPHCRDAPWGVSEAATSPVLSQTPRGRAVAFGIVFSAPETPHGASLQWGPRRNRHFRNTLHAGAPTEPKFSRAALQNPAFLR